MQNYELLFILPGTLAEDEVSPLVEKVKQALVEAGVEKSTVYDMGKSRLAYPMNHIRYGYFQIVRFEAEAEATAKIEKKLGLISEILRTLITKIKAGAEEPKINFGHDRANGSNSDNRNDNRGDRRNDSRAKVDTEAAIAANVQTEKPAKEEVKEEKAEVVETSEEPKEEKVEEVKEEKPKKKSTKKKVALDDIDKKLDEILDIDLDKV